MKYVILSCLFTLLSINVQSQDTTIQEIVKMNVSGFLDVFYVYDFNTPKGEGRQPFLYNHNRHNEFNLNLGIIKANISHSKYRANLGLHSGTYVNDNYAAEPGLLKNISEANVGIALHKNKNIWLDVGIFSSHIGFESAISADNWTLTRSLLAENSPYYLSGAKVTYEPNAKWAVIALVCNGWQRIRRVEGNHLLSFGTQLTYKPSDNILVNWSTFLGTDDPDALRRMRYFNNLYTQWSISPQFGVIAGLDIGWQQKSFKSTAYDKWWSPVIILQYKINSRWKSAFRSEYYQDASGIIISTVSKDGFKTASVSWNLDYNAAANLFCRMEVRYMQSQDDIFEYESSFTNKNIILASSLALKF